MRVRWLRLLVTGGLGFIGSNFIDYVLHKYRTLEIINLDNFSYGSNPNNLKKHENNPNYSLIKGDISNKNLVKNIMKDIDVLVVIAGREGALASVIAGMVNVPVIAVPTSNSYGLGAKGVSTLMAMLQSCSLGLAVVNIDGGLAAGSIATLIANRVAEFRKQND